MSAIMAQVIAALDLAMVAGGLMYACRRVESDQRIKHASSHSAVAPLLLLLSWFVVDRCIGFQQAETTCDALSAASIETSALVSISVFSTMIVNAAIKCAASVCVALEVCRAHKRVFDSPHLLQRGCHRRAAAQRVLCDHGAPDGGTSRAPAQPLLPPRPR